MSKQQIIEPGTPLHDLGRAIAALADVITTAFKNAVDMFARAFGVNTAINLNLLSSGATRHRWLPPAQPAPVVPHRCPVAAPARRPAWTASLRAFS